MLTGFHTLCYVFREEVKCLALLFRYWHNIWKKTLFCRNSSVLLIVISIFSPLQTPSFNNYSLLHYLFIVYNHRKGTYTPSNTNPHTHTQLGAEKLERFIDGGICCHYIGECKPSNYVAFSTCNNAQLDGEGRSAIAQF